ncbi:MAG: flippase-like domain-containing protein [Candidatus Omnitrophica bacterium]|nr:flippase-like domain-containing protein [Candidatus Omnitrophota bacterium]
MPESKASFQNLKIAAKFLLILAFFALAYNYILTHLDEFKKILQLSWQEYSLLSLIFLSGIVVYAWIFNLALKSLNLSLSLREWLGLTILDNYSNYLFFKAGIFARGFYLKKIHGLSYAKFFAIFIFLSITRLICLAAVPLGVIMYRFLVTGTFNLNVFIIFACLVLFGSASFFIPLKRIISWLDKKNARLSKALKEWYRVRTNSRLFFKVVSFFLFYIFISSFRIFLIYGFVYKPIDFSSAIIIASVGFMSFLFSVTPAALGIKEALMSYVAKLIGENFTDTMVVASLDRVITMAWILLSGFIFSIWYARRIK